MANPPSISTINMINAKLYFGNLAFTNYYQLFITPGWDKDGFLKFLDTQKEYNLSSKDEFITRGIGLLCSEAVLPASAYATSEVKDNFMGVTQEFAHTRLFTDIDLTFYVDRDYKVLNFFEAWMNYISGGGEVPLGGMRPGYYRRFNYPDSYKNKSGIYIKKFERDYKSPEQRSITYTLVNAFPKSMASIPVAYGGADLLKVSVTFNYDYYFIVREQAPTETAAGATPTAPADAAASGGATAAAPSRESYEIFGGRRYTRLPDGTLTFPRDGRTTP